MEKKVAQLTSKALLAFVVIKIIAMLPESMKFQLSALCLLLV